MSHVIKFLPKIIVNRRQAKEFGLRRYFTGKPCSRGHTSERYTSIGTCCECQYQRRLLEIQDRKTENARINKWRKKNPEKCKEYSKKDTEKHGSRRRQKIKEWEVANPEKVRASRKANEHLRRSAVGKFCSADILRIGKLQNWLCAYCNDDVSKNYCIDHIQPLARGGTNWPKNLQITCGPCNAKKSAKDPINFARELGKLL